MKPIEYLKLQAKNLHKDFKTQTSLIDPKLRRKVYEYDPKFFKIDMLVNDFNINEENFKLGNAQHVIAKLCGLDKWTDLSKASPAKIELSILLYTNMDRLEVRDWEEYVSDIETANSVKLDDDFKLQIFKEGFLNQEQDVFYDDYRLSKDEETEIECEIDDPESSVPTEKIRSLPLIGANRKKFIDTANAVFKRVLERVEPQHPQLVRELWDPEKYIDKLLLKPDMLPIDRDYALSLIDAFLVHHVIELTIETDTEA